MNHTQRHLLFAAVWLYGFPLLLFLLSILGAFPWKEPQATIWSAGWGLGLVLVFASWSLRDVLKLGKPIYLPAVFTAAWFVLFFFAPIPYLFATRGLRSGAVSSLYYLGFVCACFGGWIVITLALRLLS
jgi:hypothetical protein